MGRPPPTIDLMCVNAHGQETQQGIGAAADCNNFWSLLVGMLKIKIKPIIVDYDRGTNGYA